MSKHIQLSKLIRYLIEASNFLGNGHSNGQIGPGITVQVAIGLTAFRRTLANPMATTLGQRHIAGDLNDVENLYPGKYQALVNHAEQVQASIKYYLGEGQTQVTNNVQQLRDTQHRLEQVARDRDATR